MGVTTKQGLSAAREVLCKFSARTIEDLFIITITWLSIDVTRFVHRNLQWSRVSKYVVKTIPMIITVHSVAFLRYHCVHNRSVKLFSRIQRLEAWSFSMCMLKSLDSVEIVNWANISQWWAHATSLSLWIFSLSRNLWPGHLRDKKKRIRWSHVEVGVQSLRYLRRVSIGVCEKVRVGRGSTRV